MVHLARVYRKLEEGDFRITPQRNAVIQVFVDHPGEDLSAEDVQHQVGATTLLKVGLATVYRTIDLLCQLNVLRRSNNGEGRSRFSINLVEMNRRHTMTCIRCGQVSEFDENLLASLEKRLLTREQFQVVDHELKLYGICRLCRADTRQDTGV